MKRRKRMQLWDLDESDIPPNTKPQDYIPAMPKWLLPFMCAGLLLWFFIFCFLISGDTAFIEWFLPPF